MRTNRPGRVGVAMATSAVAALTLVGCSIGDQGASDLSSSRASQSAPSSPAADSEVDYEDGTYQARGTYGGGPSFLDVTVTIDDDLITDVDVGTPATNPTSLEYQEAFAAAVPEEVVGKDLSEVRVGKLAGSSTCPDGFNDAIAQIRVQALAGE